MPQKLSPEKSGKKVVGTKPITSTTSSSTLIAAYMDDYQDVVVPTVLTAIPPPTPSPATPYLQTYPATFKEPHPLFGRGTSIDHFWNILAKGIVGKYHIYLRGPRRIGKTSVITKMVNEIKKAREEGNEPGREGIVWHAVSMQIGGIKTISEFAEVLHRNARQIFEQSGVLVDVANRLLEAKANEVLLANTAIEKSGIAVEELVKNGASAEKISEAKEKTKRLIDEDLRNEPLWILRTQIDRLRVQEVADIDIIKGIFAGFEEIMKTLESEEQGDQRIIFFLDEIQWTIEQIAGISDKGGPVPVGWQPDEQGAIELFNAITLVTQGKAAQQEPAIPAAKHVRFVLCGSHGLEFACKKLRAGAFLNAFEKQKLGALRSPVSNAPIGAIRIDPANNDPAIDFAIYCIVENDHTLVVDYPLYVNLKNFLLPYVNAIVFETGGVPDYIGQYIRGSATPRNFLAANAAHLPETLQREMRIYVGERVSEMINNGTIDELFHLGNYTNRIKVAWTNNREKVIVESILDIVARLEFEKWPSRDNPITLNKISQEIVTAPQIIEDSITFKYVKDADNHERIDIDECLQFLINEFYLEKDTILGYKFYIPLLAQWWYARRALGH